MCIRDSCRSIIINSAAAALVYLAMTELLRTIIPRNKNAPTAHGRCMPYSGTPLLIAGWTDAEGWNANEMGRRMGWRARLLPAPVVAKKNHFGQVLTPFVVELSGGGGMGWRTANAVHLYSHYPDGLGEADTQCLPSSKFVGTISINR